MPIPTFKFNKLTRTDLLQFDGVDFVNVPVYAVGKNVMWGPEEVGYNNLTVGDVAKNISLVGHKHTTDDILGLKELINDLGVNSSTNIDLSEYLLKSTFIDHLNNLNSAKHVTQAHLDKLNSLNSYWQLDDQGNLYTTYNTYSTQELAAWKNGDFSGFTFSLGTATDVELSGLANDDLLKYNGTKWVNVPMSSLVTGGGGSTVEWGAESGGYVPLTVEGMSKSIALSTHNHSGVYEPAFTKKTAFNKNFGTTSGTVAKGNDSRINNGQTAYNWGNHASAGYASASALNSHISAYNNHVNSNLHLTQAQRNVLAKLSIVNGNLRVSTNIISTGEVTAYVASDRRLKENIKPITSALDYINKLNPVTYNWNAKAKELNSNKTNELDYGLIAQEVEEVLPNIVHGIFDDKYKSIDYIKLIPIMIGAIKELKQEINALKYK